MPAATVDDILTLSRLADPDRAAGTDRAVQTITTAPTSSPTARAAASSSARHASISSTGNPGWVVVELEEMTTAADDRPARRWRAPATRRTAPK